MIIIDKVKIKINSNNIKHFKSLGYFIIKCGQKIEIPINHLSNGSQTLINVKCDVCGKEKVISYYTYTYNINTLKYGYYTCSTKCAINKKKSTNIEKYGVENPLCLDKIKEKSKNTNMERYGFENSLQNPEIKEKSRKNCLEKYGVECYLKTNDYKDKYEKTCLEKYGVKNHNQSSEIIEKKKLSKLNKYGDENYNNKNKYEKTCLEKYGVDYPFKLDVIQYKCKKTCLEKYGTEYYNQSQIFRNKYKKDFFDKYGILPNERNLQFQYYWNKVNKLTKINKKILLDNWNGYDFYDGEYIKDNFNLNSNNKNYPTIDHKISTYYGFNNNISPEEISKIENLCITKRSLNSKKNKNCYEGKKES